MFFFFIYRSILNMNYVKECRGRNSQVSMEVLNHSGLCKGDREPGKDANMVVRCCLLTAGTTYSSPGRVSTWLQAKYSACRLSTWPGFVSDRQPFAQLVL